MSTTVAEPDWDVEEFLDRQDRERREWAYEEQLEDLLDDALCCMKDCDALATARGVLFPCFDIGEYCQPHRAQIMRVRAVMLRIYGFQNCGRCGRKVDDVLWERIT